MTLDNVEEEMNINNGEMKIMQLYIIDMGLNSSNISSVPDNSLNSLVI